LVDRHSFTALDDSCKLRQDQYCIIICCRAAEAAPQLALAVMPAMPPTLLAGELICCQLRYVACALGHWWCLSELSTWHAKNAAVTQLLLQFHSRNVQCFAIRGCAMRVVARYTGCVLLQGSHASTWAAAQPSLAPTRCSFQQVGPTSVGSAAPAEQCHTRLGPSLGSISPLVTGKSVKLAPYLSCVLLLCSFRRQRPQGRACGAGAVPARAAALCFQWRRAP
jgi:hypothetical protein